MKNKLITAALFLASFLAGVFLVDRSAQAQGVAAAVSIWFNGAYVASGNALPVHNQ